jgi:hypothetical protein
MEKKPQDTESRHADKFVVRFPDGMRDQLKEAAAENGRSMNNEIVHRLGQTFYSSDSITYAEKELRAYEERQAAKTQEERVAEWAGNVIRINDHIARLLERQKLYLRMIEKHRQTNPTKDSS